MKNNTSLEAQKAWDYINTISQDIGPRPAGSPAVQETFALLQEHLTSWGYDCEKQDFSFAALSIFSPYYSIAALYFLVSAWGLINLPLIVLPLPFVVAALPELWQTFQRKRPKNNKSQNLLAKSNGLLLKDLDLILCAHVDTARQNPVRSKIGRDLQSNIFGLMKRLAWMVFFLALLFWVGFGVSTKIVFVIAMVLVVFGVFLIGMDLWEQFAHKNEYVPGAHDNASGIAILLVLAEHLKQNPDIKLKVGFLFTDAEETGMFGAEAFAQQMQRDGAKTPVVVLDQVGAGNLIRVVRGVGRFKLYKTDDSLADLLYRIAPDARDMFYVYRNGDFSSFLRAGIPAVALEMTGSEKAKQAYHRPEDTIRIIQKETLDRVIHLMVKFLTIHKP